MRQTIRQTVTTQINTHTDDIQPMSEAAFTAIGSMLDSIPKAMVVCCCQWLEHDCVLMNTGWLDTGRHPRVGIRFRPAYEALASQPASSD